MEKIVWQDAYSVGVEEIDNQHKDFVKLIHRLQIMHEKGTTREVVSRILLEMAKYAEYHFVSEENIMILVQYPFLSRQQEQHSALSSALRRKIQEFKQGTVGLEPLISFVISWFFSHTKEEDKKAGLYINDFARNRTA